MTEYARCGLCGGAGVSGDLRQHAVCVRDSDGALGAGSGSGSGSGIRKPSNRVWGYRSDELFEPRFRYLRILIPIVIPTPDRIRRVTPSPEPDDRRRTSPHSEG